MVRELTGGGSGHLVDLSNLWVHLDKLVGFISDLEMSGSNALVDPCLERVTNNGVDYIGQVLSVELVNLFRDR